MRRKTLYIILGIVVVIIIVLVALLQLPKPAKIPEITPPVSEEVKLQTPEEVEEIKNEATGSQDVSLCEKIKNEEDRTFCQENVVIAKAIAQSDFSICDQIENEYRKLHCRDSVTMAKAIGAKDSSLCEKMSNEHTLKQCREYIASLK